MLMEMPLYMYMYMYVYIYMYVYVYLHEDADGDALVREEHLARRVAEVRRVVALAVEGVGDAHEG